jgi:uncharacterized protein
MAWSCLVGLGASRSAVRFRDLLGWPAIGPATLWAGDSGVAVEDFGAAGDADRADRQPVPAAHHVHLTVVPAAEGAGDVAIPGGGRPGVGMHPATVCASAGQVPSEAVRVGPEAGSVTGALWPSLQPIPGQATRATLAPTAGRLQVQADGCPALPATGSTAGPGRLAWIPVIRLGCPGPPSKDVGGSWACHTRAVVDPAAAAVRRHVQAFNDGDVDVLRAGLTDDAVWVTGTTVAHGRAAVAELLAGAIAALRPSLTVQNLLADGDRVACQLIETLTVADEERTFSIAAFFRLRDGRLASVKVYREGSAEVA